MSLLEEVDFVGGMEVGFEVSKAHFAAPNLSPLSFLFSLSSLSLSLSVSLSLSACVCVSLSVCLASTLSFSLLATCSTGFKALSSYSSTILVCFSP